MFVEKVTPGPPAVLSHAPKASIGVRRGSEDGHVSMQGGPPHSQVGQEARPVG